MWAIGELGMVYKCGNACRQELFFLCAVGKIFKPFDFDLCVGQIIYFVVHINVSTGYLRLPVTLASNDRYA